MPLCPSCGTSNAGDNRFCQSCGSSLADKGATCPKCGGAAVPGNKFCLSCGTSLTTPAPAPQPSQSSAVQPGQSKVVEPVQAAMVESPAAQPTETLVAASGQESPTMKAAAAAAPATRMTTTVSTLAEQQPMGASAESPLSEKPVCPACGADIGSSHKFCLACGTAIGQSTRAVEPASPPEAAPFTSAPSTGQFQEGPFQAPSRSGSKLWMIVVLLLTVMGVAGWYAWRYFARPDVTITTFQKRIHVAAGGKTSLQASVTGSSDTDVDWDVQEDAKGGRIVSLGSVTEQNQSRAVATYTAPQAAGTFHVIAASHANPGRTAKIEIVVGSTSQPDVPAPSNPASPASVAAGAAATQVLGTWRGPASDMITVITADSITMTSAANPQQNLNGRYHFTDNSHLEVDFGNGDARKWEVIGIDNTYMRVNSQSKDGASAIVFARISN